LKRELESIMDCEFERQRLSEQLDEAKEDIDKL